MVGVTFKGRLGNQIFQYVFLQYLRANSKNQIIFSPNPHHTYLAKYFKLNSFDSLTLSSKLYSVVTRCLPLVLPFKNVFIHNFTRPKPINPKNFCIYNGFYQSDWYYNQLSKKPVLEVKKQFKDKFEKLFGAIFKNEKTIVVHIRRTDYMNYGKRDISLPIEYFKTQLESIKDLHSYKVFFVSDDIEFVKNAFTQQPNFIFSSNDEITDFQLIQNADIAVISNSTFAWWAAFLCEKQNKVIAPKNWMGFRIGAEHPKGVMTDRFTWVDVCPVQEAIANK